MTSAATNRTTPIPTSTSQPGTKERFVCVIPSLLILLFVAQCAWFIRTQSLVIDEPLHIAAGLEAWRAHSFGSWNDHPPLARMWCTLPLINAKFQLDTEPLRQDMPAQWVLPDPESMALRARSMNVIFGLILAAVLWVAARRLFSTGAANLALALFVLSPSIVTHFSLATTDGAAALFIFAPAVYLLLWKRDPSLRRTAVLGVLLGLMLLSKFSAPPMFLMAVGWMLVVKPEGLALNPRRWNWGKTYAAVTIALVLVWAGYFFHVSRATVHNGVFTATFPNRDSISGPAPKNLNLSILVPAGEYMDGLRRVLRHNAGGHPSFFWGQLLLRGSKLYFPAAILLKWPIVTLLFLAAAILLIAARWVPLPSDWWILASFPIIYMGFAIFSRIDIGERHILPVYPFALLCAAAVWEFARPRKTLVALVIVALVLQAADVLRYAPDYLSYFTPFVRPSESYKLLTDSNLDWGQGMLALRHYQQTHPDEVISAATMSYVAPQAYGIHVRMLEEDQRATGTIVLGASAVTGQYLHNPHAFKWVLQYPRIAILDHSLFVFRVPPDAADSSTTGTLAPGASRTQSCCGASKVTTSYSPRGIQCVARDIQYRYGLWRFSLTAVRACATLIFAALFEDFPGGTNDSATGFCFLRGPT